MRAKSFADMTCSVACAMEAIGDRWALLLLRDLSLGLSRYDQLLASTGMPTTTLAGRLKHLEASGLIERRPYRDNPPRFEYMLTDKGRDLWKVTTALREWGDRWRPERLGAPTIQVVDRRTGRPVELAPVDAETGLRVPRDQLEYRAGPGADETVRGLLARYAEKQGA